MSDPSLMDARRVISPLTGRANVETVRRIPVSRLQRFYRDHLGVDIDRFVGELDTVEVCRCLDTGFEFYWPLTTAGDASFYDDISKHPWYYDPDRWEHREAAGWLEEARTVLDVGCGDGAFLELVGKRSAAIERLGLELSPDAARVARGGGADVVNQSLEVFARDNGGRADVVTAFEVLEHVADPLRFIIDLVSVAKPGGLVILGVPDNDGFTAETESLLGGALNMPPHHMGRWRRSSLESIVDIAPVTLVRVAYEPLEKPARDRLAYARLASVLGGGRLAGLAWRGRLHRLYSRVGRAALIRVGGPTILVAFRRLTNVPQEGGNR